METYVFDLLLSLAGPVGMLGSPPSPPPPVGATPAP